MINSLKDNESLRRGTGLSRYYSRQAALHGNCFYLGNCEPIDETERRIRETLDSIEDAESLAGIS